MCKIASTENVAVNERSLLCAARERHVGIADNQSYPLRMLCAAVAVGKRLRGRAQTASVAAGKHRAADVGAVADDNVCGVAVKLNNRHVASAIDVFVESAAHNVHARLSVYACHVGKRLYVGCAHLLGVGYTVSASEHRAVENAAIDVELHVAIGLAKSFVVAGIAAVGVLRIEKVSASSAGEYAVLAVKLSTVDGERRHSRSGFSVHVATATVWRGSRARPQAFAHESASSAINAVDRFGC